MPAIVPQDKKMTDNSRNTDLVFEKIKHLQDRLNVLEERDRKFSLITEHIPDLIWFLSLENMRTTYITPSVNQLLGYTQQEIMSLPFRSILLPESFDYGIKYLKDELRRIQTGESDPSKVHTLELGYIAKNGATIWAEVTGVGYLDRSGKFSEILGVSRDITKRKLAEKALIQSEERYHTLFESSIDAIYITTYKGAFIEANPAAVRLFGYDQKEDLLRTPIQSLYSDPGARLVFQETIGRKGFVKDYLIRFRKKDGTPMDCLITSTIWRSEDEAEMGYQGIIRDITEQNRLKAQLLQAQKMEAVGTLAGGIAHNFNNILMTIQGNASLMLMKTEPGHPHFHKLKKIEEYIRYGAELSNQLLGFARSGSAEPTVMDINRLIDDSARMFSRSKREITIRTEICKNIWPVLVDQGQMEQVLLNLFVNAGQAMPQGGKIYIVTSNIHLAECQIAPFQERSGRYVKISVTDTGIGMDDETRQKIFDPFFTTKKHGEGTGLGLSTVYGIIKQHDGYITVYSEPGKGATFNIYLPATERRMEERRMKPVPDQPVAGNETILLVDDEQIIKETGQVMLEELGYTVFTAQNGAEALRILQENRDRIDLVILDMIMPDMSGSETFDRLQAINPLQRILLSSGYGLNDQVASILKRGCNGFIQKPFSLAELSRKVREILDTLPGFESRPAGI